VTGPQVASQYATGLSRPGIEQALVTAGKDLSRLTPADLGALEDFHTLGRIATRQLAEVAGVTGTDTVLDAGCGIGGTARFLASQYQCRVTAIDLTEEYCQVARWLSQLVGLDHLIEVRQGDVTALPFADGSFTVVTSQHVQMNVADKAALYAQARRVLAPGGRLAAWDVTAGEAGEPDYPQPWADRPGLSHLVPARELRAVIESAGLSIVHWADLTADSAPFMQALIARPPAPLGLHNFVADFARKAANLTAALSAGRARVIQAVAVAA
jgi:SAM-dependent methyltransferase